MANLEKFKHKIDTAEDIKSIVKTMKALAAVSIRQYEKAVISLGSYDKTLEMGLRIILKNAPKVLLENHQYSKEKHKIALVIFGSDQGMCGQFNEKIANYTLDYLKEKNMAKNVHNLLIIGVRLGTHFDTLDLGEQNQQILTVPSSIEGITPTIQEIVFSLEKWQKQWEVNNILVFYNDFISSIVYQPRCQQIFPLNIEKLKTLQKETWDSRSLPTFTMSPDNLASALFKQHFFVSLYRACAESLASENASRLASMQVAEKNIAEKLSELKTEFQQQRQTLITEELLDIISGFESLNSEN